MGLLIRGKTCRKQQPANRLLIRAVAEYSTGRKPRCSAFGALRRFFSGLNKVGGEFFTADHKVTCQAASTPRRGFPQQRQRYKNRQVNMSVPEGAWVFGKTGKAETATDCLLETVETTIHTKRYMAAVHDDGQNHCELDTTAAAKLANQEPY